MMFEGGVRMLGLLPGLTLEEFGELARLLRGELSPFTDFATWLQSSQLPHVVYRIDATKPGMPEHPSISIDSTISGHANVLSMLDALSTSDPALRAVLLKRLERLAVGYEMEIGSLLPTAGVELAMCLLRVLEGLGTDAAREAVRAARDSGPALVMRIKSGSFDALPIAERRQAFATLSVLLPSRAQTIAIGLLRDQRVISTDAHEATRELACEVLGRVGSGRETREALEAATKSRSRSSERVWLAASAALSAFDARAGGLP
jgi:hypothetical protein